MNQKITFYFLYPFYFRFLFFLSERIIHKCRSSKTDVLIYTCVASHMNSWIVSSFKMYSSWDLYINSVQFSCSVLSDSLWPHESQHARPLCPSPSPRVHSNSCPSSRWCHPAISSLVIPFSSCPQSFPASGFFQWINSLHEVAKVLEFQLQHQSFQWTPRTDLL